MVYYCVDCQQRSEELGEITGKEHEQPKVDYYSGETCEECGGTVEMLPT